MKGTPDLTVYRRPGTGQLPFSMSVGDSAGTPAHVVCGYLGCDATPFNPLLAALPRVIHIPHRPGGAIGAFVQFAIAEAREQRQGGEVVLGHLSELMFVDVVRQYLATLPAERTSWLAALREPFVGRAVTALKETGSDPVLELHTQRRRPSGNTSRFSFSVVGAAAAAAFHCGIAALPSS